MIRPAFSVVFFFLVAVSPAWSQTVAQRLYFSTGDYGPNRSDDGILVFDDLPSLVGAGPFPADRVVPMDGSNGNFGHSIYLWESADELFVASIFTNSILVYDSASTMDGTRMPAREIWGVRSRLLQPHGLCVDEGKNILYVANSYGGGFRCPGNILVFDNASGVTGGMVQPSRFIEGPNTWLAVPLDLVVDPVLNLLYVANANPDWTIADGWANPNNPPPSVNVYANASTAIGNVTPVRRIFATGPGDPLNMDPLVHDIDLDPIHDDLYVANQNEWVLVYHPASTINGDTPATRELAGFTTIEGLFYVRDTDQLFVSDIATVPDPSIKIYDAASTLPSDSIGGTPDRMITWTPDTYVPSQPLWVTVSTTTSIPDHPNRPQSLRLLDPHPNPFSSESRIGYTISRRDLVSVEIFDVRGALVSRIRHDVLDPGDHVDFWNGRDAKGNRVASGVYWVRVESGGFQASKRLTLVR